LKGNIALKGFYFIRKSFTWKMHINLKPKKPDTSAAVNWEGGGKGPLRLLTRRSRAFGRSQHFMRPGPFLSLWNAAAYGVGGDAWESEVEQKAQLK
jgi:hypothetical protein